MININIQYFGGRGGGGGKGGGGGASGGGSSGLPKVQQPIKDFPELSGTEKQVNWADKIRTDVYNTLVEEMYKTESGFVTKAPDYITSTKGMQTWVNMSKDAFPSVSNKVM